MHLAAATTIDPAAIIIALATLVTALGTLIVAIRNGQKSAGVQSSVDIVHDCLHRRADRLEQAITEQQPGT